MHLQSLMPWQQQDGPSPVVKALRLAKRSQPEAGSKPIGAPFREVFAGGGLGSLS